jgi:hypothetical protein
VASRVTGTVARLRDVQAGSLHYLQRPDARHPGIDSSATSMTGYGARLWLNKQKGNLFSNSAIGFVDPRFDVNDMGFQSRSNVINAHSGLGYKWTAPRGWRKYAHVLAAAFESRNFDGDVTLAGVYAATVLQFTSNHEIDLDAAFNPQVLNDRLTRGGPLALSRRGAQLDGTYTTDGRRRTVYSLSFSSYAIPSTRSFSTSIAPAVEWKPVSNFSLQLGPEVDRNVDDVQYVAAVADPARVVPADFGGQHYVFARIDQTTLAANVRLNVSFTPNLSLQTFLQPLVSSGRYTDYKELARSRSYDFLHHSAYDPATQRLYPDAGDTTVYAVTGQPSFNFKSLRGNAVLRWEYRPGSALFLVWTQERTDDELFASPEFRHSFRRLLAAQPDDIFLVKLTYYLGV